MVMVRIMQVTKMMETGEITEHATTVLVLHLPSVISSITCFCSHLM